MTGEDVTATERVETRAMTVRREAERLLASPNGPRALAEMVVAHRMLLDEALARIAHLEALMADDGEHSSVIAARSHRRPS